MAEGPIEVGLAQTGVDPHLGFDELIDFYGSDIPDSRRFMDSAPLREAVRLAREGRWDAAVPVFRDEAARQPDWDVPHVWLAGYLADVQGRSREAITLCRNAAAQCRSKGSLLSKAGEWALLGGEVPESVHLLALSLTTHGRRPDRDHIAQLSALAYLGEIFDSYVWAMGMLRTGRNSRDSGTPPPTPGDWVAALRGLDRLPTRLQGIRDGLIRAYTAAEGNRERLAAVMNISRSAARHRHVRVTRHAPNAWEQWAGSRPSRP
ncbi:hypothetical protein [Streptomyces sp. NPDC050988]|uniref:hypothetical protein n=1 Tax=Streptomyces sp. NPDC050988 TaxID=3365637 RepID=UPI003792A83D